MRRRTFLKMGAAGVPAVGMSESLARYVGSARAAEPLKWLAQVFSAYPEQVKAFTEATRIQVETTLKDQVSTIQTVLTGGDREFHAVSNTCSFWTPFQEKKVVSPVAVDRVSRWRAGVVADLFLRPERVVRKPWIAAQIRSFTYADAGGKAFSLFPYIYNFDTIGYNPTVVKEEVTSWGALFDPRYRGRVAIFDVPTLTLSSTAMYLVEAGLMPKPERGEGDLTRTEVDRVIKFLIDKKRAGQFRTTWIAYGDLVNLLASGEVWLADAWQPIVTDVRRAGTPCAYATVKEGSNFWFGGLAPLSPGGDGRLGDVIELMKFHLGGWFAQFVQRYGYSTPAYPSDEVKRTMGPEYYGWAYEGRRTSRPVKDPFLFVPETYEWSMTSRKEHPQGHRREGGSIADRIKNIGSIEVWPKENEYYFEKWQEFRNA